MKGFWKRPSVTRWLNRLLLFLNIVLLVAGLVFFSTRKLVSAENIDYKDLVVILLAAVAVILAAVTLFVGVLAIYGYATLRDLAVKTAKETALEVAPPAAAREAEAFLTQEEPGQPGEALVAELQAGKPSPEGQNGG